MLKHLIAILLTALILTQVAGVFLYFPAQLWRLHRHMEQRLEQYINPDDIQVLHLSAEALRQSRVGRRELDYQHQRYDILHATPHAQGWTLHVVADPEETILIKTIQAAVHDLFQPVASGHISYKYLDLTFLVPGAHTSLQPPRAHDLQPHTQHHTLTSPRAVEPVIPPPRPSDLIS